MRGEDDGRPGLREIAQGAGDQQLRRRVEPLRRLVEQQQVGIGQQQLREREQLLLAARQIVGMVGDARVQTEARENAIDRSVVVAAVRLPLAQLLGHRIAHEEGFRILREQRLARGQAVLNAAALRLDDPGDGTQQRGLAAAVAAYDGVDAAGGDAQIAAAQNPVGIACVAQMDVVQRDGVCGFIILSGGGCHRDGFGTTEGRHPGARFEAADQRALSQLHHVRRVLGHRLGGVGGHDDGDAQLAVHAKQSVQEVLLGHGIELGGGLVKQQQARLHRQRAGQRGHLLLAAR